MNAKALCSPLCRVVDAVRQPTERRADLGELDKRARRGRHTVREHLYRGLPLQRPGEVEVKTADAVLTRGALGVARRLIEEEPCVEHYDGSDSNFVN